MVDTLSALDDSDASERFIPSDRQSVPLAAFREVEPGNVVGPALSPLLHVPSEVFTKYDVPNDVVNAAESPTAPAFATSTTTDPPIELSLLVYVGLTIVNVNHSSACGTVFPRTFTN